MYDSKDICAQALRRCCKARCTNRTSRGRHGLGQSAGIIHRGLAVGRHVSVSVFLSLFAHA